MKTTLVITQFVCSAAIVLGTRWQWGSGWLFILTVPGALLAVWAWAVMGLKNIRVMPDVAAEAKLITSPPYRWIRHPMYSGLLLFCAGFLLVDFRIWRFAAFAVLAVALEVKSRIEERLLDDRFSDYNSYAKSSWKFVPFLY